MRSTGATYEQIATSIGCSTSTAWKLVRAGLDRVVREPARELIAIESARLDSDATGDLAGGARR